MPKPQREPTGRDGSPEVEDRTSPAATDATLMFGQFRVLLRQRRLLAGGVPIELGARAFDILMVLIGADGALVTKDELQSRVWPGVVVAQDNLKVQIYELRKALGGGRELIRTEHGRGYRFTAAVRVTVAAWECSSTRRVRGSCRAFDGNDAPSDFGRKSLWPRRSPTAGALSELTSLVHVRYDGSRDTGAASHPPIV